MRHLVAVLYFLIKTRHFLIETHIVMMSTIFHMVSAALLALLLSGCQGIQFVDSPIPVTTLQPTVTPTPSP